MEAIIEKYPTVDLTKTRLRTREDVQRATTSTYAEINKWLLDKGYHAYNLNGVLMNKLIYFVSVKARETNPGFVMDTGWYMYGPCYEAGRRYEQEKMPIVIKPVAAEVSPIVGEICDELIPLFRQHEIKGTVLSDFLRYIYAEKCDQPKLRDYYLTKHDILGTLYRFTESQHDISKEKPTRICEQEMNFQSVIQEGDYSEEVGLKKGERKNIADFVDVVFEYLDFEMDQSRQLSYHLMTDIFNASKDILLAGLSHLNYSKTFESSNRNFQGNVRRYHSGRGHDFLGKLEEERKRISRSVFDLTYLES
jgi:hypothetical protein